MKTLSINEQIFLIAICRLGDEAYGVKVRDKISELTGKTFTFGNLYNTLDNLAKKGFVISKSRQILKQAGGNRRVYYSITKSGHEALREAWKLQEILWKGFPEYAFKKRHELA